MVPGFTERECRAADLRRQDLLVQAARERSLTTPSRTPVRRTSLETGRGLAGRFAVWIRAMTPVPNAPSGR